MPRARERPRRDPERARRGDGGRRARGRHRRLRHPRARRGRGQRAARRARRPGRARHCPHPPARGPRAGRARRRRPAAAPCRSASTATASPAASPTSSRRRSGEARLQRHRAPAPRPRGRRGRRRRALHLRRRDARARHRAGLARRRPARRRGVADRLGQVLLRARPRPRLPRHRRHALPRRPGSGWSARYLRQVPPDSDPSEVTARRIVNWIYAWQGFGGAGRTGSSRRSPSGSPPRRATCATRSPPSATTARSSCTRSRSSRFAFDDVELRDLAVEELDRNLAEDFLPDGVHRECSTHYHMIALRSFAGLRENARRHGVAAARRLRGAARPRRRVRPPLLPARRHDPGALGRRHRRLHGSCSSCSASSPRDDGRELPRRRLLHAAQRRPLPDLRLRAARRRRPRPLRPAQLRGLRRRAAAGGRPRPLHLRRGRAEPAPLVQGHGGAQHGLRRRARPDARTRARRRTARPPSRASSGARRTSSPARRTARSTRPSTAAASASSTAATG